MFIDDGNIIPLKPCGTSQESCRPVSVLDIDINIPNRRTVSIIQQHMERMIQQG